MVENPSSRKINAFHINDWRKRRRFSIQSAALVVALLSPFGLHWGLETGQNLIAIFLFGLLALALALTAWIG
jgi:hypothetical protein